MRAPGGRVLRDHASVTISKDVEAAMTTTQRLTIEQVKGDQDWSALEQDLLNECTLGRVAYLPGKEDCPKDTRDPDRRVRPALIRYLIEGGCDSPDGARPHTKGVKLAGAWIDGALDCEGSVSSLDIMLLDCLFENPVSFLDAELGALYLPGSRLAEGLDLHRLKTKKDLFLREGFHATGMVNLLGADIGGLFDCSDGRFDGGDKTALDCNGVRVGADVFLRDGLQATGLMDFAGAQISGGFVVENARIEGTLDLDFAKIEGGFFWRDIQSEIPVLDLTSAKVEKLEDKADAWKKVKTLHLSGFSYSQIHSNMGVQDRLDWLARKVELPLPDDMAQALRAQRWLTRDAVGFDPQPYTHLAKVLEAQGNRSGAARVLAAREDRLRAAEQMRAFGRLDGSARAAFGSVHMWLRQIWNFLFKWIFGYGHQPFRALIWFVSIWTAAFVLYGAAYRAGQMVPNSDVILTSTGWLEVAGPYFAGLTEVRPAVAWQGTPAGQDYESFSAGLYALDLFVPLDALGQETTWAPSKAYGTLGTIAYWARMPIQLAGWIITAVGAAVLTGLIGRKE
jgi:hypothetical protein